ncbi:MAG TPA: DUF6155 family protein [Saprospiraceae bacterium]|nr:DUF6155 family protein [Saprospiraceae bacterium]
MGLREVKSELKKLDKEQLIKHIAELYKKYQPVKEYFDFYVEPDEEKLLEKYKQKVHEAFFPKRGYRLKLGEARKAINDFKKLGPSAGHLSDLLLCYVENGVAFTNTYGDIDERFYISVENTYGKALELMQKNDLLKSFQHRAYRIVTDSDRIGWGFHDELSDLYHQTFEA